MVSLDKAIESEKNIADHTVERKLAAEQELNEYDN